MTAPEKPPADLTCPEPTYGDIGGQNKCGRPVKRQVLPTTYAGDKVAGANPTWFCGMHANMHDKRRATAERREHNRLARERERAELAKRTAIATNLATFLTEQLGVTLSPAVGGHSLVLSIEEAQRLYESKATLVVPE